MVIMIVIKKENIMVTTFEVDQTNVEGSSAIRALKKQKGGDNRWKKGEDN
jgi:hypothetical protein